MSVGRWIGGAFAALAIAELAARGALEWGPARLRDSFPSRAERLMLRSAAVASFVDTRDGVGQFDAELGWTLRPGFRSDLDSINAEGQRSLRSYSPAPNDGVLRVAAFGDSFVYGSGVDDAHAWSSVLEREHPNVEVLNHGVPAYGPDQSYLRARREAARFAPDVVVLGISCHTLACTLESIGHLRAPAEFAPKPRFELAPDGSLALVPTPIQRAEDARPWIADPLSSYRLGGGDFSYEPLLVECELVDHSAALQLGFGASLWLYRHHLDPRRPYRIDAGGRVCNRESPAFRITAAIASEFTRATRQEGRHPLVLILPDEDGIQRRQRGATSPCQPLLEACRAADLPCLDASEPLLAAAARGDTVFEAGHYSETGNAALAHWLAERFAALATAPLADSRPARAQR